VCRKKVVPDRPARPENRGWCINQRMAMMAITITMRIAALRALPGIFPATEV
jgi:hypothetical protein